MKRTSFLQLFLLILALPLVGLGCKNSGAIEQESLPPITLNYWRVFDEPGDFTDISAKFKQRHPNVTVVVKKLRFEEYEDEVVRALASGEGPDIVSVQASWLRQYQNLLTGMPESVTLPTAFIDGKNIQIKLSTERMPSARDVKNRFVDVVSDDVVIDGTIYGLPLSIDTLVLFYNRTLFNQANIPTPPRTWNDFKEEVKLLTIQDRNGEIVQSGAAFGGSGNINRAPDILSLLMIQNGTTMTNDKNTEVMFNQAAGRTRDAPVPGQDALRFYTDFASPAKEVYTWNESMPESLNAFASNRTAMFLGYSYHLPLIRSLAPGMDLGVSPAPQISETGAQVNFANYWVEGVTKQSGHQDEAWAFVNFMTEQERVTSFLENARKPTALRALIANQREDAELAPFANQLLTATSWYRGKNAGAMESALRAMIRRVTSGELTAEQAVEEAVKQINASY